MKLKINFKRISFKSNFILIYIFSVEKLLTLNNKLQIKLQVSDVIEYSRRQYI